MATTLQTKFAGFRSAMAAALIERDDEIDLALTALVARENVLFVGPPDTETEAVAAFRKCGEYGADEPLSYRLWSVHPKTRVDEYGAIISPKGETAPKLIREVNAAIA